MNRRRLLVTLLGGVLTVPLGVEAQSNRVARVATLSDGREETSAAVWATFRRRLQGLGYGEGVGYVIESRWAQGNPERLQSLAGELAARQPSVIVADGTPAALAAKRATSSIPIVAIRISDPVTSGLVASLARPGGNITGSSIVTKDIAGKWVELLREIAPGVRSVAFLNDTTNAGAMLTFRELREQARLFHVKAQAFDGRTPRDVEQAFSVMTRERTGGLIVGTNAVVFAQRQQIVEAAARLRIPAIYARREYVEGGGLMSYGADLNAHYSHAADFVDKILKGARPADLPVEQPTRFDLVINLKAAQALGITIPESLRLRAHLIE